MTVIVPVRRPPVLFIALYTVILLGACSSHHTPPPPQSLDFTLPDLAGHEHSLSDYRGKWVLLNYWATWCKPCLGEIPQLTALAREYNRADVVILGIDYEDLKPAALRRFKQDHRMDYPVLRTDPAAAQAMGPILGLPTTYVIAPNGAVAATLLGPISQAGVERLLATQARKRGLPTPRHT